MKDFYNPREFRKPKHNPMDWRVMIVPLLMILVMVLT